VLRRPVLSLLIGLLGCLVVAAGVVVTATATPWLGLVLRSDVAPDVVMIVSATGPARDVPTPSVLVGVAADELPAMGVEPTDLVDEPDAFDRYETMRAFFGRQDALVQRLRATRVRLDVRRAGGDVETVTVNALSRRPIASLPTAFWFQLGAGCVAFLVGLWVLVLRPRIVGVRMFALTAVAMLTFTSAAAIYSTREIALDGRLFRFLSATNHLGAIAFGVGLVGLFLSFPTALVPLRTFWVVPAIFLPWWMLDCAHALPNQSVGHHGPIMAQMLAALVLAGLQWRRSRSDPRARASLRWFGVCVVAGSSLFVFNVAGAALFSTAPLVSQGYSFGFFLLMHVGLALGLRRTRLFELNALAYAVLAWALGALVVLAVDGALLFALGRGPAISTGLALLVVGASYLPVRAWLWSKLISPGDVDENVRFRHVLDVVFANDRAERERLWLALFDSMFSPLEIRPVAAAATDALAAVRLEDDGLRMCLPAVASLPALEISRPWRGRGIFGARHVELATGVLEAAAHAEGTRDAFARGVREERARVARDLHDDIGARLMSGIYQDDPVAMRQTMQSAILDMRSMVDELVARQLDLGDVLGNLRHETRERLEQGGVELVWPLGDVAPPGTMISSRVARAHLSMMREITSNALRHARAETFSVEIRRRDGELVTAASDDGVGFDGTPAAAGNGIRNLRRRAEEIGGTITFTRLDRGTRVEIVIPLG
jgi:signal transduction histidine kinase